MSRQTILMCAPDHFGVDYIINPWMEGNKGNCDRALAAEQWTKLKGAIAQHADVTLIPQQKGLPDQVFTANAGLVLGRSAVVSRFKAPERQGEEPLFSAWFRESGFDLATWPSSISFEGAGDALLDRGQAILWSGFGFRSDAEAPPRLEKVLHRRTIGLHLVDPRFYHLDTCFCPLEGGFLMYLPAAFDGASQKLIELMVPPEKRIVVGTEDALQFACNAVDLDGHIFMNGASETLQTKLRSEGFTPVVIGLSEFMKAGGAAKCLTLKIVEQ